MTSSYEWEQSLQAIKKEKKFIRLLLQSKLKSLDGQSQLPVLLLLLRQERLLQLLLVLGTEFTNPLEG